MSEPEYMRPFDAADFRGYFTWDKTLTNLLGGELYHACHEEELEEIIETNQLVLRSTWALIHPEYGLWDSPGVWCGLNFFHNYNRYGPFLISFPLKVLNGRTFMVFRRTKDRKRYFFVEYEAMIPIFKKNGKLWRKVKASKYFDDNDGELVLKNQAIYDLVITRHIQLHDGNIKAVEHQKCIPKKCNGRAKYISQEKIHEIAKLEFKTIVNSSSEIQRIIEKYPSFEFENISLDSLRDR